MEFNPPGWIEATERIEKTEDLRYLACSPSCMAELMAAREREIG
jgi:hypothetical protein